MLMTAEDWRGWAEQQRDMPVGDPPPRDDRALEPSQGVWVDPSTVPPLWGAQHVG